MVRTGCDSTVSHSCMTGRKVSGYVLSKNGNQRYLEKLRPPRLSESFKRKRFSENSFFCLKISAENQPCFPDECTLKWKSINHAAHLNKYLHPLWLGPVLERLWYSQEWAFSAHGFTRVYRYCCTSMPVLSWAHGTACGRNHCRASPAATEPLVSLLRLSAALLLFWGILLL